MKKFLLFFTIIFSCLFTIPVFANNHINAEAIENAIQSVPSKERGAARSITRAGGYKPEPSQVYTTGLRGKVRSRRGEEEI